MGCQIAEASVGRTAALIIGCFPWKFQGREAAFARVVAFDSEWPKEV
jgi:hypothetical protein